MIPVTKPYLPDREKLNRYIDGIYERNWLTNNGPLVQELTRRLEEYLDVDNLLLVSNGTLALQIAYLALGIHEPINNKPAEAIATPFTFVATASSLKWEGVHPVFVDIDPDTWNLAPKNIEAAITNQTSAIVPVHVFGNPCEVEQIQHIAQKHNVKVIYDAAHAFGVTYKGKSILNWGDAATLSFHATKVFHTIEGGAIVFKHKDDLEKARKIINFGLAGPDTIEGLGVNAKMNEFQAAMGLCVLDEMEENLKGRADVWLAYEKAFSGKFQLQSRSYDTNNNYAYFPLLMNSEEAVLSKLEDMKRQGFTLRRYFYPSLNQVPEFGSKYDQSCVASLEVARRIICAPLYGSLDNEKLFKVISQMLEGVV